MKINPRHFYNLILNDLLGRSQSYLFPFRLCSFKSIVYDSFYTHHISDSIFIMSFFESITFLSKAITTFPLTFQAFLSFPWKLSNFHIKTFFQQKTDNHAFCKTTFQIIHIYDLCCNFFDMWLFCEIPWFPQISM